MLSTNHHNADYINVHSKRKKENLISTSLDQTSPTKKYKISFNDNDDNNSLPSISCNNNNNNAVGNNNNNSNNSNKKSTIISIPPNLEQWLMMFRQWSNNERIIALDSLVMNEICEIQQMRHLLSIIEPQLQRDFISLLPKELSLYVLSFLDPPDLLRAAQTCHYWRILCEDNLLWREKCREEGLLDDHETLSDLFASRISSSSSHPSNPKTINKSSTNPSKSDNHNHQENCEFSEYKLAYLHHKNIEYNWRYGILNYNNNMSNSVGNTGDDNSVDDEDSNDHSSSIILNLSNQQNDENSVQIDSNRLCSKNIVNNKSTDNNTDCTSCERKPRKLKEILHLKGHEDHVITCLQFNPTSNIIVSGSDDNTLKVWSSITGKCLRTLSGHTGGVWSSQLSEDNIVISGSTDRTLRVWNALNGQCLHTLYGHTSTVRCMALNGIHVVSGSRDTTLRVWNYETGECVHVLVGHMAAVRCVQFNGQLCVSGAYDYLVKVWDVESETCLHTLEGHSNRVYSLQFDGRHIVSGSLDTSIRVWCAETGQSKHTLIGHQSLTSGMQLRNNILVSGNADSTVRVWDINTGQCLQTLSGTNRHQSAVTCLQFNSKFVITSSDDGTVKLWDLKTGEFIRNLVTLPSGGSGGVVWRIRASNTKLVCAVGSRNGTEETKLLVLDFETPLYASRPQTSFRNDAINKLSTCDFITDNNEDDCSPITPNTLSFGQSSLCYNCKYGYTDLENEHQQRLSTNNDDDNNNDKSSTFITPSSSSHLILESISSSSSLLSSTATTTSSSTLQSLKNNNSQYSNIDLESTGTVMDRLHNHHNHEQQAATAAAADNDEDSQTND